MIVFKNDGSGEFHVFQEDQGEYIYFTVYKGTVDKKGRIPNSTSIHNFTIGAREVSLGALPKNAKKSIRSFINES